MLHLKFYYAVLILSAVLVEIQFWNKRGWFWRTVGVLFIAGAIEAGFEIFAIVDSVVK
ncbi:hypothetical protein [Ralstonia phage RSP15]|uniref:hypothetical protein n=1 Tax=Ralstonia phage RSP15 TaxID=1785960 RepID=UPI00074D4423|nr:hypothetical protein BH754_gp204 [Ralstonia phage RSP15]BAU40102.1 hypothetical protein [Ralstonia phage RSP15]